jgi:hypothetical protein
MLLRIFRATNRNKSRVRLPEPRNSKRRCGNNQAIEWSPMNIDGKPSLKTSRQCRYYFTATAMLIDCAAPPLPEGAAVIVIVLLPG